MPRPGGPATPGGRLRSRAGRALALAILLSAACGAGTASAQRAEPRLTPAPSPTVRVPKMTPVGPVRGPALNPLALVQPPPKVAAPLSAPIVAGKAPAPPPMSVPVPAPANPVVPEAAKPGQAKAEPPRPEPSPPEPPEPSPEPSPRPQEPAVATAPTPAPAPTAPTPAAPAERKVEPAKPDPKPEPARTEAPARRIVRTTEDVNLRAGPSRSARVVDELTGGTRLEVMGAADDGWVPVGRNGRRLGYIAESYLTTERGGQGKATAAAPDSRAVPPGSYAKASREDTGCALPDDFPTVRRRAAIAGGQTARVLAHANLRVAPACDAKVKDVLERGETVTVQEAVGSWYRVGRGGRTLGYVGASLLEAR